MTPAGDDAQKGHMTQSLPCPQSPEVRNQKGAVLPWGWAALSSAGRTAYGPVSLVVVLASTKKFGTLVLVS